MTDTRGMRWTRRTAPADADLDGLQVVTKRDYRRGYEANVGGEPIRLRYVKVMNTADGHVLVHRPPVGQERQKASLRDLPRALAKFLLIAWPVTVIALLFIVALIAKLVRGH